MSRLWWWSGPILELGNIFPIPIELDLCQNFVHTKLSCNAVCSMNWWCCGILIITGSTHLCEWCLMDHVCTHSLGFRWFLHFPRELCLICWLPDIVADTYLFSDLVIIDHNMITYKIWTDKPELSHLFALSWTYLFGLWHDIDDTHLLETLRQKMIV